MATPWRATLRGYCEAFTYIEPLPNFCTWRSPDNFIWQNTTDFVIPGGGVVVLLDPDTDLPIRLGVTDPGCAICPGDLGRLNLRGVVEVKLVSPWVTDIIQGAKIYLGRQADGSWRASNVAPAIGFLLGRAIINYEKSWLAGESAKAGSQNVQVQFEAIEPIELFGVVTGELDNDVDVP